MLEGDLFLTKNFVQKINKNSAFFFFFEKLRCSNCAGNYTRADDFERTVLVRSPVRVRSAQPYSAGTFVHYFTLHKIHSECEKVTDNVFCTPKVSNNYTYTF